MRRIALALAAMAFTSLAQDKAVATLELNLRRLDVPGLDLAPSTSTFRTCAADSSSQTTARRSQELEPEPTD